MPPGPALAQQDASQRSTRPSPEEARVRHAAGQQDANDRLRDVQGRGGDSVVQKKTSGTASGAAGNAAAGPMSSDMAPHKPGPVAGDVSPTQAADFGNDVASEAVQKKGTVQAKAITGGKKEKDIAAGGVRGKKTSFPHKAKIQKAFGRHQLGDVEAYADDGAKKAAKDIGAKAYAMGNKVAFGGSPDLHTAAHEAAHVIQQRAGIKGGGKWETHADKVADAVVAGQTAEPLLDEVNGGAKEDKYFKAGDAVQKKATDAASDHLESGYFKAEGSKDSLAASLKSGLDLEAAEDEAKLPAVEEKMGPETEESPADTSTEPPADPGAPTDGVEGSDPAPPDAPVPQDVDAPAQPAAPNVQMGEGTDIEKAKGDFKSSVRSMPASVSGLQTSPGPPPDVELSGKSDPLRSVRQDDDTELKTTDALADAQKKIDEGPGPEQVQPVALLVEHKLEVPKTEGVGGMPAIPKAAEFDAMASIKSDIKAKTDEISEAQLKGSVQQAQAKLDDAQADRKKDHAKAVDKAQAENKKLIEKANKDQGKEVAKARKDIEKKRGDTKKAQDREVSKVNKQSDREQAKLNAKIDKRVAADEKKIAAEFEGAEKKAGKEKSAAEKDAAKKKADAEAEAANDSWWSRAVSAVTSAFDAIAGALTAILDTVVSVVNTIVEAAKNAANALIDAAVKFVSAALEAYGELLKGLVSGLLGDIFPGLAAALNEFIDSAVDLAKQAVAAVGEALKKGISALLDFVAGALNAIVAAYKAAIEAALALAQAVLTGDWSALGRMILEGVLKLAGISPAAFWAVMDQAMGSIDTIVEDPGGFVGNVIDAASGGFSQFGSNILTHLKNGFFEWIVGPLGEMGVTLPSSWDLKGIFGLVTQVLGLTKDGIKKVVTEELGEAAGSIFDYVWRYVGALLDGGLEGLWEEVKNDLNSLYSTVIDGIKSWLVETIIKQAVLKLATMFNPVGALLNAVMTVWNVISFLKDQMSRIFAVIQSVVSTIAQIAAGNTQPAKDGVEKALASLIPIAIDLLAKLLGLGGITKKVKEVIDGVQEKVQGAIRSLVKRVKGMFAGRTEKDETFEPIEEPAAVKEPFDVQVGNDTEAHNISFEKKGEGFDVMVASTLRPIEEQVAPGGELHGTPAEMRAKAVTEAGKAKKLKNESTVLRKAYNKEGKVDEAKRDAYLALNAEARDALRKVSYLLMGAGVEFPSPVLGEHTVKDPKPLSELPDKQARESHHLPPNASGKALYDDLSKLATGYAGASDPDYKLAGEAIKTKLGPAISDDGGGMSAILVHRETHRLSKKAFHRASMADEVEVAINQIRELFGAERGELLERVTVRIKSGKISTNPGMEQWKQTLLDAEELAGGSHEVEDEVDFPEEVRICEKGCERVDAEQARALKRIPTDLLQRKVEIYYNSALEQGVAAVVAALANSKFDGPADKHPGVGTLKGHADTNPVWMRLRTAMAG